jgi:DNA-binding NtrC family response regulator
MSSGPLITDQCLANALNIRLDDLKSNVKKYGQGNIEQESVLSENITHTDRRYPEERENVNETTHIEPLSKIEEQAIKQAIDYCEGNVVRAASLLQVSPSTLYRKVQSWEQS